MTAGALSAKTCRWRMIAVGLHSTVSRRRGAFMSTDHAASCCSLGRHLHFAWLVLLLGCAASPSAEPSRGPPRIDWLAVNAGRVWLDVPPDCEARVREYDDTTFGRYERAGLRIKVRSGPGSDLGDHGIDPNVIAFKQTGECLEDGYRALLYSWWEPRRPSSRVWVKAVVFDHPGDDKAPDGHGGLGSNIVVEYEDPADEALADDVISRAWLVTSP
jgi:hypothetical protein